MHAPHHQAIKGKSIEHFIGKIKELSENCELGNQEDTLIRDVFVANMQDPEIQKELLKETVDPAQALRLAINIELGLWNQLKFANSQPSLHVNAITPKPQIRTPNQQQNFPASTRQANQLCQNCGLLGQQLKMIIVLLKAKRVTTVVYKTICLVCATSQSLSTPNHPDPM